MREVLYDTETTGKRYQDGHRIVEVAAIELIDGVATGRVFHKLINPERSIPADVIEIHGITDEMVAKAPRFKDVLPELLEFFRGATAIAHNAEFDEKFINHELQLLEHSESFWSVVGDTADTIQMSRKIWVGKDENGKRYGHALDAVLDRCGIDRSARVKHGALIDTELLAQAYLSMKAKIAEMGPTLEDDAPRGPIARLTLRQPLPKVAVSDAALQEHHQWFADVAPKASTPKM